MPLFALALAMFAQKTSPVVEPVEIPFRQLSFGSNGKIKDGGATVIRDEKAFAAYRKEMGFADSRKPIIDWTKEQLVEAHTSGAGYGGSALTIGKVRRKPDGGLEIEAWVDRSSQPVMPQPGSIQVLRNEGLYSLVAVSVSKGSGDATLKIVEPPKK